MNRVLMASLLAGCLAFAPSALADVPGDWGSTGNAPNGNQGCWTIPIYENGQDWYKNPGDMFQNEKDGDGLAQHKADNEGKNPKQLADTYPEYFANVGDMIDQQCGAGAVTPS